MKVEIIKSLKKKKINDVLNVSLGYYKNFLAPNKIAVPLSRKETVIINTENKADLTKIYSSLKDFTLIFEEKGNDTGVLYSSINLKLILKKLNDYLLSLGFDDFYLYPHSVELQNRIKSAGEFFVNVFLSQDFPIISLKIIVSVK